MTKKTDPDPAEPEKPFQSFLKTVGGGEGDRCHYPTRLDLYGKGCQHDCKYCYAKSLLEFRNLWNNDAPARASIDAVLRRIPKLDKIVRLGGMTDCFMPLEAEVRNTYRTIEALNKHRKGYLIVTKSALVARDDYASLLDPKLAHVQISVTATDDEIARKYEGASLISERISAIEKLAAMGIDTTIRLSPFIPEFLDLEKVNAIRCDKVLIEFLRVNTWIRRWFDLDFSAYTLSAGQYLHLPLERKIEALRGLKKPQISVCEDVPEHYDYWQTHLNQNPDDCCNLRRP